MNIHVPFY